MTSESHHHGMAWDSMVPTISGVCQYTSSLAIHFLSPAYLIVPCTCFLCICFGIFFYLLICEYLQLTHFISHKAMNVSKETWTPLHRYPDPAGGGGDSSSQGSGNEGRMDGEGNKDTDVGSSEPGVRRSKRSKVTKAGGSYHVPTDVTKKQDQQVESDELWSALKAEAAAIEQCTLEGIAGFGCTGYVFSLRWVTFRFRWYHKEEARDGDLY